MTSQRDHVTTLFHLAEAYDFEAYQERLSHLALNGASDAVSALSVVKELESRETRSVEAAHALADDLLLRYIDQDEITRAFNAIHR